MNFQNEAEESDDPVWIRGKDETEMPIGQPQDPEERPTHVWRCADCGEIGEFEETLPRRCPSCHAGREQLAYLAQD